MKKILSVCTFLIASFTFTYAQLPSFQYYDYDTVNEFTGYSAIPLKDSGYAFLYTIIDQNDDFNAYLQFLNNKGNPTSAPVAIGTGEYTAGYSILQTADGGFIIGGDAYTGYVVQGFLIKTDNKGTQQWVNYYGLPANYTQGNYGLAITKDGGYIIAGNTQTYYSNYETQIFIARTNSTGDTLWTRTYGDTSLFGAAGSVENTSDGGFIITGSQVNGANGEDVYILKIDSTGKKQWDNHFGGVNDDFGNFGTETKDHGYIFAGKKALATNDTETQSFIIKTDSTGSASWAYLDTNFSSTANGVVETTSGDFVAAGLDQVGVSDSVPIAENDAYLLKISSTGTRVWSTNPMKATNPFKISDILFTSFAGITQTSDGGFLMPGTGTTYDTERNDFGAALLVKTDSNGNISATTVATGISQITSPLSNPNISIYPNPFSAQTVMNVSNTNMQNAVLLIFDMDGNVVKRIDNINSGPITIDRVNLNSGMYFYRLVNDNGIIGTGKLMAE